MDILRTPNIAIIFWKSGWYSIQLDCGCSKIQNTPFEAARITSTNARQQRRFPNRQEGLSFRPSGFVRDLWVLPLLLSLGFDVNGTKINWPPKQTYILRHPTTNSTYWGKSHNNKWGTYRGRQIARTRLEATHSPKGVRKPRRCGQVHPLCIDANIESSCVSSSLSSWQACGFKWKTFFPMVEEKQLMWELPPH